MKKYFQLTHANDNKKATFALTDEGEEILDKILNNQMIIFIILSLAFIPCFALFLVSEFYTFLFKGNRS